MTVPSPAPVNLTGQYAGPVSRALALALDVTIASALFAGASAGASWIAASIIHVDISTRRSGLVWLALLIVWTFLYHWVGLATVGKTVGKAVVGLRVVARDGSVLSAGRAAARVAVLPVSLGVFGLGGIGAVIGRERRALHDVVAGSAVVYEWGGRDARLPSVVSKFLARNREIASSE